MKIQIVRFFGIAGLFLLLGAVNVFAQTTKPGCVIVEGGNEICFPALQGQASPAPATSAATSAASPVQPSLSDQIEKVAGEGEKVVTALNKLKAAPTQSQWGFHTPDSWLGWTGLAFLMFLLAAVIIALVQHNRHQPEPARTPNAGGVDGDFLVVRHPLTVVADPIHLRGRVEVEGGPAAPERAGAVHIMFVLGLALSALAFGAVVPQAKAENVMQYHVVFNGVEALCASPCNPLPAAAKSAPTASAPASSPAPSSVQRPVRRAPASRPADPKLDKLTEQVSRLATAVEGSLNRSGFNAPSATAGGFDPKPVSDRLEQMGSDLHKLADQTNSNTGRLNQLSGDVEKVGGFGNDTRDLLNDLSKVVLDGKLKGKQSKDACEYLRKAHNKGIKIEGHLPSGCKLE